MKASTKLLSISALSLVLIITGLFFLWRKSVIAKRANLATAEIELSLKNADFVSARSALAGIPEPSRRTNLEDKIRGLELEKAVETRDVSVIRMALHDPKSAKLDPELLENAAMKLARDAMQRKDYSAYEAILAPWKNKTQKKAQWSLIEADALINRKEPEKAYQYLKSLELTGKDNAQRLVRMAILEGKEPWKSMVTLDEALKFDPKNPEILSFRAQIQEAAGRLNEARYDYVAAVLSDRVNPLYRDSLANFYLRTKDLSAAAETWRDAAIDSNLGIYFFKSWFWSKLSGRPLSGPLPECGQANWTDLIAKINKTPVPVFWSPELDEALVPLGSFKDRPEIRWLRLLEELRQKNYAAALKMIEIQFTKEDQKLNPNLVFKIRTFLYAREGKDPRASLAGREIPQGDAESHLFLKDYIAWVTRKQSEDDSKKFEKWLADPNALVSIMFTADWLGAAVSMGDGEKLQMSPITPEWFDYGYAKSILIRDGNVPCRTWLQSLATRSTAADLLLGEILLTTGELDDGLEVLGKVAAGTTELSSRAAWTLALTELDRGQSAKALEIVNSSPELANGTQGKEIMARIALAEGTRADAIKIYQELGEKSADAMIFLSKEAFAANDFDQAEKWTKLLAQRFPSEPFFRKNLIKISEARTNQKQ